MGELIFIKLGGSLITDKRVDSCYRAEVVTQLGETLRKAWQSTPDLSILLAHGSGSFGHSAAARFGTMGGVASEEEWLGFTQVAHAAAKLNHLVRGDLLKCRLPIMSMQPSTSLWKERGRLVHYDWLTVRELLARRVIPLIYGDVALDAKMGGAIASTEEILAYLVPPLLPQRILLLGDTAGVYDGAGKVIPSITPANFSQYEVLIEGSSGVDVTGGMWSKVRQMVELVKQHPSVTVRIMGGSDPNSFLAALKGGGAVTPGTLIQAQ
ncbi:MAG: isopentenyl phosphate kinase [Chloroflexi bacterium]|nr:isopentenyl phosphate kinase [Chloroflexota bacterium]